MSLRAGLLTEKITIKRATIVKNDYGEDVETWTIIYTTRARITNINSAKQIENDEVVMNYSKQFFMRYYVPIQEYDVIEWNTKQYRVMSIDKDRENVYIKVIGELIND